MKRSQLLAQIEGDRCAGFLRTAGQERTNHKGQRVQLALKGSEAVIGASHAAMLLEARK